MGRAKDPAAAVGAIAAATAARVFSSSEDDVPNQDAVAHQAG